MTKKLHKFKRRINTSDWSSYWH